MRYISESAAVAAGSHDSKPALPVCSSDLGAVAVQSTAEDMCAVKDAAHAGANTADYESQVRVCNGLGDPASPAVLDLKNVSAQQLMQLSKQSGADTAFQGCLLLRAL